uniref:Homeobox domain-containing protein n=1 Tax=Globodera rostochiensis TaxID=31243 RepID=A0A914HKV7_GLORO
MNVIADILWLIVKHHHQIPKKRCLNCRCHPSMALLLLARLFTTESWTSHVFGGNMAESVQLEELEELPLQTFDELFVDEWWDKDEAEDLKTPAPTNFAQNVHHQIDRQNTQKSDHSGPIEPNSTDQNPPLTESDHSGQIEPNSTDQNPPLTESDHSDNAKNEEELIAEDEQKEKFEQMKAELKRTGFKSSFKNEIDKTVAKELGLSFQTIYRWKRKLGQTAPKYPHSEQKELMKRYYEIKDKNSKTNDKEIAKMLKIGRVTLCNWKKQFKRQQFHPNSVDGHSDEENDGSNVQEIDKSYAGII